LNTACWLILSPAHDPETAYMKKRLLLYCILIFPVKSLLSQSCKVSVDSLKGVYTGNCDNGKADGKGTATGTDLYTGSFKNGYPDGEGKYTWKNGSWYDGSWKNGLFEGQGVYSKVSNNREDSSVLMTGFWKKGKYLGRYEKPYIAHTLTNNISDLTVRKLNGAGSEIVITVKSITGGASGLSGALLPKSRLTGIQLIEGRFEQQATDETSSPVTNKYILRKVTFPFYAIFSFEATGTKLQTERVGIEFYENCNWYVQVSVDN